MTYHLALTPDEETWSASKTNLLLTEWCRPYNKKSIWNRPECVLADPYGMSKRQRDEDHDIARRIESRMFPVVCDILNETHQTSHSHRFWKIILGFWMFHHINVITNRYRALSQALSRYDISSVTFYSGENYSLATRDYEQYIWALNNPRWNNELFKFLFSLIPQAKNINLINISHTGGLCFSERVEYIKKNRFRNALVKCLLATSFLAKNTDAFYLNTLLPKSTESLIRLSKFEWPIMWERQFFHSTKSIDRPLREKLRKSLIESYSGQCHDLETAVAELFFELIPQAHLEHFKDLSAFVAHLKWPNRPRFVFASGNFDSDEVFKLWTARKVEEGIPYYTGQHGSYGHLRHELNPSPEEVTSDRFFTWGWSENKKTYSPVGCFKFAGRKSPSRKCNSHGILLVQTTSGSLFTTYDRSFAQCNYFSNQLKFVGALTKENRSRLQIRLLSVTGIYGFFDKERWLEYDPQAQFDTSGKPIFRIANDFRVVVNSYDSTAILELLYLNIPNVAFWENPLDHLRDSAVPYYQKLMDAGILFPNFSSCADFLNSNYNNIDAWWKSGLIQDARSHFIEKYAKEIKAPVRTFRNLLYQTENPDIAKCRRQ